MPETHINKKKRSPRKRFLHLAIALMASLVAAVGAYMVIINLQKGAVELAYGDYSITKEQYDELIAEAQELTISTEDAREVLIASLKAQAAAEEVGIEEDRYKAVATVLAYATAGYKIEDVNAGSYHQRAQYVGAIAAELGQRVAGGYQLAVFELPFTKRIVEAQMAMHSGETATPPTTEEILADRAYARQKAEEYHAALAAEEMSIEAVIDALHNDERLTHGAAANTSSIYSIPLAGVEERADGVVLSYGDVAEQFSEREEGLSPITDMVSSPYEVAYPPELTIEEGVVQSGYRFTLYLGKTEPDETIKQRYNDVLGSL